MAEVTLIILFVGVLAVLVGAFVGGRALARRTGGAGRRWWLLAAVALLFAAVLVLGATLAQGWQLLWGGGHLIPLYLTLTTLIVGLTAYLIGAAGAAAKGPRAQRRAACSKCGIRVADPAAPCPECGAANQRSAPPPQAEGLDRK